MKSKVEWYRQHAADRVKLLAKDDRARAILVHMADAWLRLAEPLEKAVGSEKAAPEPL